MAESETLGSEFTAESFYEIWWMLEDVGEVEVSLDSGTLLVRPMELYYLLGEDRIKTMRRQMPDVAYLKDDRVPAFVVFSKRDASTWARMYIDPLVLRECQLALTYVFPMPRALWAKVRDAVLKTFFDTGIQFEGDGNVVSVAVEHNP